MNKAINKSAKRIISFILSLLLIASSIFLCNGNDVGSNLAVKAASTDYSIIRVQLTTMASLNSITITVNGTYSLKNIKDEAYSFRNGVLLRRQAYTFKIIDGNIVLCSDEGEFVLGNDVTLYSHEPGRDNYLTMYNRSYGTCNYVGNMRIYVQSGYFVFINELNLDDYLCGVVPYEMSNAQAVESLKVQAVCARSYAYRSIASNPNAVYHVVDTTAHQVYKGYKKQYTKCIAAVDQTAYQVLTYNGSYISTYYSASNGGLTESNANAWGGSPLGYLTVKVDEYDTVYRNREYTLSKTDISSANQTVIKEALKRSIQSAGYDYNTLSVLSIDSYIPTYASEPETLPETERRVYSVKIGVTVKAKKTDGTEYETFSMTINKLRESLRTFLVFISSSGSSTKLPSTRFTVTETDTHFIVSASGNGHGIGMSQNGVYARVAAGQTYREILEFYFTGTQIKTLQYEAYIYDTVPSSEFIDFDDTAFVLFEEAKTGIIDSDVPVYENTGAIYGMVCNMTADTEVSVVGETDAWYAVTSLDGAISGYIRKSNISIVEAVEPPPDEINDIMKVGIVTEAVWARSTAEYSEENLLRLLEPSSEIIVLATKESFYKIYYNDSYAYVSSASVSLRDETVYEIKEAEVTAYKATLFSRADELSEKTGFLQEGAKIQVFNTTREFAGCVFNGVISYIKSDKIDILQDEYGYSAPRPSVEIDINVKVTVLTNVYKSADDTADVIDELIEDDIVRAVVIQDDWYKIVYGEGYAYIKCGDAIIYSDNITIRRARATADKLLYTSSDMTNIADIMLAGDAVEVLDWDGYILTLVQNGSVYYTTSENMIISTQQAVVVK